jgi:hypothetical protein
MLPRQARARQGKLKNKHAFCYIKAPDVLPFHALELRVALVSVRVKTVLFECFSYVCPEPVLVK